MAITEANAQKLILIATRAKFLNCVYQTAEGRWARAVAGCALGTITLHSTQEEALLELLLQDSLLTTLSGRSQAAVEKIAIQSGRLTPEELYAL